MYSCIRTEVGGKLSVKKMITIAATRRTRRRALSHTILFILITMTLYVKTLQYCVPTATTVSNSVITFAFRGRNVNYYGGFKGYSRQYTRCHSTTSTDNTIPTPSATPLVTPSVTPSASEASINVKLDGMKLTELKDLLKSLGGTKPGSRSKRDILGECRELILKRWNETKSSSVSTDSSTTINSSGSNTDSSIGSDGDGSSSSSNSSKADIPLLSNKYSKRSVVDDLSFDKEIQDSTSSISSSISDNNDVISSLDDNTSSSSSNGHVHVPRYPVGGNRDNRLNYTGSNDMDIVFLGTASCIPSISRGVSCVAFRYQSDMWLFDCGEASQIQIQKSRVKASKIKKSKCVVSIIYTYIHTCINCCIYIYMYIISLVFLTHAHGDHSFGLPGVLCLMGQSTQDERSKLIVKEGNGNNIEPIEIYGPEGTRDLVRAMIQLTYSRVVAPHIVHELKNVPYLHGRYNKFPPPVSSVKTQYQPFYGEQQVTTAYVCTHAMYIYTSY